MGFDFLKICKSFYSAYFETLLSFFLHSLQASEREKQYETIITGGQTQYINMAESSHNYDVIGYRHEWRQKNCS